MNAFVSQLSLIPSFFEKSHTQPEQDGSVPPVLVLFGFVYHVVQMFLSNVHTTGNLLGLKLPSLTPFFVSVLRIERAKPARHDTFKIPALAASTVNITCVRLHPLLQTR